MKNKTMLASAIAAALALNSWSAIAQDAAPQNGIGNTASTKTLATVTVTGSRIRSVDLETAQPLVTLTREQIAATGLANVSDVLQREVAVNSPDITPQDTLASGPSVGGSYTSLRNLGSQRTLVLVNGRRWSTDLNGLTDLSTIPTSIIDRIEILKDGASSIYGSDAIGGVVNIITRDHYDGAEANVYYGQNQHGDGQEQAYNATFGTHTLKSSTIFTASYQDTGAIWDNERNLTRYQFGPNHIAAGLGLGEWGRVVDPANPGQSWALNSGAINTASLANYHLYDPNSTADKYNPQADMTFRAPNRLKNLFVQQRYNLTDNITLHAVGNYSERGSTAQMAGYPLSSNGNQTVLLSGQSAFNPFPGRDVSFFRRIAEMPRITQSNEKLSHLDLGAIGYFTLANQEWSWDADFNYSKADVQQTSTGNLNLLRVQQALGPTAMVNGQLACANPVDRAQGCVPWNVLAGPQATTAAVRQYIEAIEQASAKSTTRDFTANVSGGVFDLPAGTVNLAAGVEHRRQSGAFTPDQFAASGLSTDLASAPTRGKYTVNEAYAELDVPLLRDLPGARELAVNLSSRYSHYSNFGSTTNRKYSFRWKPIDDLLVRGTYAEGFRAPTLNDLYGGAGQTFDTFLDPCDSVFGAAASVPGVTAACHASGVPAGYRQVDITGAPITSTTGGATPVPFLSGSNPQLKPETSTTGTMGLVYSPHQLQGLNFTLDYYRITVKGIIGSVSANDILDGCYVQGDPDLCARFSRNANGSIAYLNESLANIGTLKTEGYDFGAHYRLPQLAYGQFVLGLDSSYLRKYDLRSSVNAPVEGLASFVSGTGGLFRLRANASLGWSLGNYSASWTARYYSGLRDSCWDSTTECNAPNYTNPWIGSIGANNKGAVVFNDVQFGYKLPWRATVSVGVNNLFGKQGPLYYSAGANGSTAYLPSFDIDRYYYLSYTQKF